MRQLVIAAAVAASGLSVGVAPSYAGASERASSSSAPNNQFQFSAEPYAAAGAQQRSDFSYQLLPGHQILDQLVIRNASNTAESFLVYGEDATNNPRTGAFGFEQRSRMHNTLVGRWVAAGTSLLTVPPGKETVDTFQLSIPPNAPPGDHVGAVIVEQLKGPVKQQNPTGVNLVLRIGVPVFVRVVGKSHPGLTIENLTVFHESPAIPYVGSSKVAVRFDLVNTGNDILYPTSATVSITGLLSGTIHEYTTVHKTGETQSRTNPLPLQMLPGARLSLTEEWNGIPPFDPLTAHVSAKATDPSTTQHLSTSASSMFWYFPWILVLIVLALIAGVIAFIVFRRRRKASADGAPPSGDSGDEGPPPAASTSDRGTLEGAGR